MERQIIPNPVIWTVGDVLGQWYYSHSKLNTLFGQVGAPGVPPEGTCIVKCQNWLFRINEDCNINPIQFLGDLLCPFMSLELNDDERWVSGRRRILDALAKNGLVYQEQGTIAEAKLEKEDNEKVEAESSPKDLGAEIDFISKKFRIALSFPGEKRAYVAAVANALAAKLDRGSIFYDLWFQAQLARPNLDLLLQELYLNRADLVVVFLCKAYEQKDWPWIEWKAIRQLLKQRKDESIMFVRFDEAPIPGTFATDGFIDANVYSAEQTASFILQRINANDGSAAATSVPTSERTLPNDRNNTPRLVCALPRGLVVVERIVPDGSSWSMVASYFDFEEGWRHGTHYHPSYYLRWQEDGALEKQCFKVGIPEADWLYATWPFYLIAQIGEASTYEEVKDIISSNSGDDQRTQIFEAGEFIYPDRFANEYAGLLKTHALRDLLEEIEELLKPRSDRWGSLHEMTFSLRLRTTMALAKVFESSHPSNSLITELLNQHGDKKTDADIVQWLRLVKIALIDVIVMLRRGK